MTKGENDMKRSLLLTIVVLLVLSVFSSVAAEGELREITYVLPRTAEVLEDTPFWVAQNLGYLAEEGLTLKMEQAFGTTDLKMVATGQADFAAPGPSFILAGIEEGLPIKVVSAYDAINMCVLNNSKVQTWDDMKGAVEKYGKKLTVALGDASWEMLVTPTLVAAGVDPVKDIEWVVAGENRYIQVAEGKLDMLFTWPGEAWQLIGQGYDFKYIDGDDVLKTNSNSIITNLDLIKNEPEVVQGFVTALAKSIYFVKYNPEAAAAVSCNQWPNIDVTWTAALYVQQGRAYQMFGAPGGPDEQKLLDNIGFSWEDKWMLNVKVAKESGVIKTDLTADQIFTNEFFDNTWDRAKVEADADSYDVASAKARYKAE
jgi:ABC-type nitrate/sulfonate/bicarbonate transport system substrate-binding protein